MMGFHGDWTGSQDNMFYLVGRDDDHAGRSGSSPDSMAEWMLKIAETTSGWSLEIVNSEINSFHIVLAQNNIIIGWYRLNDMLSFNMFCEPLLSGVSTPVLFLEWRICWQKPQGMPELRFYILKNAFKKFVPKWQSTNPYEIWLVVSTWKTAAPLSPASQESHTYHTSSRR